jgi:hypothetical protein
MTCVMDLIEFGINYNYNYNYIIVCLLCKKDYVQSCNKIGTKIYLLYVDLFVIFRYFLCLNCTCMYVCMYCMIMTYSTSCSHLTNLWIHGM